MCEISGICYSGRMTAMATRMQLYELQYYLAVV